MRAPARRAIAISSARSSPTTSVRAGVTPSTRHISRSAIGRRLAERERPRAGRLADARDDRARPAGRRAAVDREDARPSRSRAAARPPRSTRRPPAARVGEDVVPADEHDVGDRRLGASIVSIPRSRSGATTPGPPSTSTDLPGWRRAIQRAATTAGFMNSSSASANPSARRSAAYCAGGRPVPFVKKSTRRPLARTRSTVSTAPAIGCAPADAARIVRRAAACRPRRRRPRRCPPSRLIGARSAHPGRRRPSISRSGALREALDERRRPGAAPARARSARGRASIASTCSAGSIIRSSSSSSLIASP